MPPPNDEPTINHEKSEYRLLYVGRDVSWYRRLKSVLGLPANRLVYCPGGSGAEDFLKSDIRYGLFLFDLDLLNETGLEMIRLVRSLAHRQHIPIIIVAAHDAIELLGEHARCAGANECLTKTEDLEAAAETIQRLIRA
jgi:CheY-like chemotaxis protein